MTQTRNRRPAASALAGWTLRTAAALALALIAAFGAADRAAAQAGPNAFAPAAFVNGKAVTNFDVDQRRKLMLLAGLPDDREAALQSVIDDRLKRTAAKAAGIQISPQEVEAGLGRFAEAQGAKGPQALEAKLRAGGVSLAQAREFIESELMWSALVRRDYGIDAQVTDAEVEAEIAATGIAKKVDYSLGELAVPDEGDPSRVRQQVQVWVDQMRAGADFEAMARAHSRGRTAAQGGRIGWVPAEKLPPQLVALLGQLPVGGVTDPLTAQGAVVVLKVFDKREQAREVTQADRDRVRARMIEQRMSRQAEGRLQQLRARAYVERR